MKIECKLDADRLKQGLSVPPPPCKGTLTQENGASTWLTTLPIREYTASIYTREPSWTPWPYATTGNSHVPPCSDCACGRKFFVGHALSCPKGGFPSIRNNEIRDVTANLLSEIC